MPSLRQIRLATGLVLYVYVTLHFANHALGNISTGAMESGLAIQKLIWQSPPGAVILYISLLTHMSLGFWALYERRRFHWTRLEATQLVLGLSIPFLLTSHVIGTRAGLSQFGLEKGYAQELVNFWVSSPLLGALQAVLLLIVWIHGCLGVHFWLRLKPFYPRAKGLLLSIAVLLPALALLGFYQGGERTLVAVQDPAWRARTLSPEHVGSPAQNAILLNERTGTLAFLALALAATLSARAFRQWREHRVGSIRLTYPDRTIRVARGFSILEASLINGIPHAHVCGGRGRCSTCRIRILGDVTGLPVASAAEQAVLDRVHAAPGIRLACQLRPTSDISLVPMLSPYATAVDAYRTGAVSSGVERYVVIMFVD
ncbi:MAG TPA: 2Fe-2S iron-sulfur cluster-binding protein, partial [Roseiarcus sp.]